HDAALTSVISTLSPHDALPISLNIAFQCLRFRRGWQVSINGGDFKSGNHTIRRQEMEWRVSPGNYESMKPAGQEVILARSQDYPDRKSTRLNSSHVKISYAVFC